MYCINFSPILALLTAVKRWLMEKKDMWNDVLWGANGRNEPMLSASRGAVGRQFRPLLGSV